MQKQVEVRMDESHLEPRVDPNDNMCGGLCDKIMKNMVLTLTILGKFFFVCLFVSAAFIHNPSIIHSSLSGSGFQLGVQPFPECI